MLINRTYRTYYQDYFWLWSGQKMGGDYFFGVADSSSSSSSSLEYSSSSSSSEAYSSSSSSSSEQYSSSSSSSSSSLDCPNNISSITATIRNDLVFASEKFLSVNINGSTGGNNYIELFSANTSGSTYDANRIFYGNSTNSNPKLDNGFISIVINGSTYYIRKYSGDNNVDCCTNLFGNNTAEGTFTTAGFVFVDVNGTEFKYVEVFTKS